MTRRLGHKERNRIYPYVIQRDGDYCLLCAVLDNRRSPAPPGRTWELDHADSNRANWSPGNIHAVCHDHHEYLSGLPPGKHKQVIHDTCVVNMRERESKGAVSNGLTVSVMERLGYKSGPVEMKARDEFEPKWLDCAHMLCSSNPKGYPQRAFINDCGKYAGCARTTSKNYYETHVLAPIFGEFEETIDNDRQVVVVLKAHTNGHPAGDGHKGNGKSRLEASKVVVKAPQPSQLEQTEANNE